MISTGKHILTVFEHQVVRLHEWVGEVEFDEALLKALQEFHGEKGVPYFSLGNKSVKFCEYVGVIQIGRTTIEVLPKADNASSKAEWRSALIGMLRLVGIFNIEAPTSSSLKIKPNSVLDLYFELFAQELERLVRLGLMKKYAKIEGNCSSLKGSIQFGKNIQRNLLHKERFFTKHTVYDRQHTFHQILFKTLSLLQKINTNSGLQSRISTLLLNFPEQAQINVSESTFEKIIYNRKSESYRKALEISRLLLLNFHPNISQDKNHVLALMFDMNMLWERFVFVCLKHQLKQDGLSHEITAQTSKYFWKPNNGYRSSIKPDIIIKYDTKENSKYVVLDTKWKNLHGYNPSPSDLRQLYVYHEFYDAQKVALVYPGKFGTKKGIFYTKNQVVGDKECSVMGIEVSTNINEWRKSIAFQVMDWLSI